LLGSYPSLCFFLVPGQHDDVYEEHSKVVAKILLESIANNKSGAKDEFYRWIEVIVPGYLFGAPSTQPDDVTLDQSGDPSNTNSEERYSALKKWVLEVGANSLEDTPENRRYMNIVRTTDSETYKEWFDSLKSLSKDLLTKSASKWDFRTGNAASSAEIIGRLLLPFKPEWVNSKHLPQFQGLVNSLSKNRRKMSQSP
jgi:hypothetical protein